MTSYVFVSIDVNDPVWMNDYFQNVPALIQKHGGSLVAASQNIKRYEGSGGNPDRVVILRFPSMKAIDDFIQDTDYRPYLEARLAGSSCDLIAFEAAA